MIILNETIIINPEIEADWIKWINNKHIPSVLGTGYFSSGRVLTVLNSPNEGITFCIQYATRDFEQYQKFQTLDAKRIEQAHFEQFENKFVRFETIMEIVSEYESNNNSH